MATPLGLFGLGFSMSTNTTQGGLNIFGTNGIAGVNVTVDGVYRFFR